MRAAGHRADHRLDQIEIAEAAGAAVATYDLLHRAAEVDVDEIRAEYVRDKRGSFAHRHRVRTEDLNSDRMLLWQEAQLGDRRLILATNPLS